MSRRSVSPRVAALAGLVLLPLAPVPPAAAAQDARDTARHRPPPVRLLELPPSDRVPEDPGVPRPWTLRELGDAPAASASVEGGATPALRLRARGGEALQVVRRLDEPLSPEGGTLAWCWRVDEAIPGADLSDPGRDDAPARLFVVFGEAGLFSRPRSIFYSWGRTDGGAAAFESHVSGRIGVVPLGSGGTTDGWRAEARRAGEDYRDVFGEAAPDVTAVGFMIDADQTGARASAALAELTWWTGEPVADACPREDGR